MLYETLWVSFFVLVALFAAALVAKLMHRAVRGPVPATQHPYRRQDELRRGNPHRPRPQS